ncbi:MAG: hypothetical protein ACE5KM_14145 [Planctomycetaceae bacterium]
MSESATLDRRDFSRQALGSLLTFSLLETLASNDLFADEIKPVTTKWLTQVNELGKQVKGQTLKQTDWQKQIEALFKQVELPELLRLVNFDRLTKDLKFVDNGARSLRFKFPKVEGLPTKYVFGKQIFALKKDRSVVPHGHNNMATAFLILKGDLHGRHYDRLKDEKESMIIKPTIDRKFAPGEYSTISDFKDNIHWFKAVTEPAFIFNIHVLNVRPGSKLPTGRVYIDPNGEKLKGGLIKAKRIGYKAAHKLYG